MDVFNKQDIKNYVNETADRVNSNSLLEYAGNHAAAQPVFFYPECGCDWNPIARFSDVCRVFIFCSKAKHKPKFPRFALEDCPNSLKKLFFDEGITCGFLNKDVLQRKGNLQSFREGCWMRVKRKIEVNFGVGRNANTFCKIERKLFLAFLEADPAEVFQKLFVEKGIGPRFVCLHQERWDGGFRDSLVNAGASGPKYLVGKWPIYTPWTLLWQKYRSWKGTAVFQQQNAPAHELQDAVDYENLNWVNTPMNPDNVEGAHVVHLTVREYLAQHWPNHIQCIFIDADRAKLPAEFWEDDLRLSPLKLAGLPISKALPKLADACHELQWPNIQAIHTSRFGFEDETAALREVWPKCCPWSLTIHCETQGEMDSLRGFVCGDLA